LATPNYYLEIDRKSMLKKSIVAATLVAVSCLSLGGTSSVQTSNDAITFVRPFCQLGMQFLVASLSKNSNANGSGGLAVVQVLGKDGKPMTCVEDAR
jgi:hypothetical protein